MSEDSDIDVKDLKDAVDKGEEILSVKEMLMHYPIISDIVRCIPDELIEMLVAPLRMMSPIYTMMYQFEHMLESFIEPFLFGQSRNESDDPMMRCMEGRYNLFMQKWLKPFMSMVPCGGQFFDVFIELHKIWVKYCPTYLMMSIVAPEEFAKRKYWDNFPEPELSDIPVIGKLPCIGGGSSCNSGCSTSVCPFTPR